MVQWFVRDHTYQHPWKRVTLAFWKKYPNPLSPQVQEIEILDRHVDEQGRLHTTRLLTCRSAVPEWITSAVGGNHAYVLEKSMIDNKNHVLIMKSRNLSWENLIQVEEICAYQQHPDTPTETLFTQEAKITVPIWGFSSKVENLTLSNFQQNANKGTLVMEKICQNIINDEGSSSSTSSTSSSQGSNENVLNLQGSFDKC